MLLICPYCFERFKRNGMAFRCANPTGRCPQEFDEAAARYEGLPAATLKPRAFIPPAELSWLGHVRRSAVCQCGYATRGRICPHCHHPWPNGFDETDNIIIAVIGTKDVGKSHFLAVLINELTHRVGLEFKASLTAVDDATRTRFRDVFEKYLYRDRVIIPATAKGKAHPLIYRLSFEDGLWFMKSQRVLTVVFFDTAGENFAESQILEAYNRYMAYASGLLFLLDPLQIPAVQDRLPHRSDFPTERTSPLDVIGSTVEQITNTLGTGTDEKLKIPVAVTFSKLDEIYSILPPDSPARRATLHPGYFDLNDFAQMNETMRRHVRDWVGPGLEQSLDHRFSDHGYFGVSALGGTPHNGKLPDGVAPRRVEDPFLWLLYKLNVIKGKRRAP